MEFYLCNHCKNLVTYLNNAGVPVMCCGEKMTKLEPNTTDAANEKHVPVVTVEGNKVSVAVGSVAHPMMENHYIMWIALETSAGVQIKYLKPDMTPKAEFVLAEGEKAVAAYEYCNLHGLWKAEV